MVCQRASCGWTVLAPIPAAGIGIGVDAWLAASTGVGNGHWLSFDGVGPLSAASASSKDAEELLGSSSGAEGDLLRQSKAAEQPPWSGTSGRAATRGSYAKFSYLQRCD